MSIVRHPVKSCCRSKSFIFETSRPILKPQLRIFTDAGYVAPPSFSNAGVFYVRGKGLVATSSFGATRINVRCSGNNCSHQLDEFQKVLEKAISS